MNGKLQMALIARLQHPYTVEFKEAWVEKVCPLGACICYVSFALFHLSYGLLCEQRQGCYVCIVTGYCEGGDM